MNMAFTISVLGLLAVAAVVSTMASSDTIKTTRREEVYYDLSYSMNEDTIFYPGVKEFQLFKDKFGWDEKYNRWYSAFSFCMGEHGGTHIDAPNHFYKDGWSVEQIPMTNLVDIEGIVIDIESKVRNSTNPAQYLLSVQDIIEHEIQFGVSYGGIVFIHTGWSKYWSNKFQYLGWDNSTEPDGVLNFPGISEDAAKWLFNERQILGLGIDTPSVDQGNAKNAPVHIFLAKRQVYNLENVANLHLILNKRRLCSFFILPMKIVGGTGSPTRILAKCPQ